MDINANAAPYDGDMTSDALLEAIYKTGVQKLFLTGLSLEDSRRFNRPEPSGTAMQYDEERNRNYYPYPETERNSNPNTRITRVYNCLFVEFILRAKGLHLINARPL
ncbi:hypothetical protein Q2T40_03960 [Winogradskyella maritima]|nr:hypothetical protein [Winogradskyella maritima]